MVGSRWGLISVLKLVGGRRIIAVILSSGVIGSPKILVLPGIGPKQT